MMARVSMSASDARTMHARQAVRGVRQGDAFAELALPVANV
jgi:hypothetical protein